MKVLVLGAGGQVGGELARLVRGDEVLLAARSGLEGVGHPVAAVDATVPGDLRALVEAFAPDIVFNATAYTAVDRAESEPEVAFRVNRDAVAELAAACRDIAARLVHFSTDYVFDGTSTRPYLENDPVAPASVYGRSKQAGEAAIEASDVDAVVLRTAWVFGSRGHNFMRTMLRLAGERDVLRVVGDQRGCPTGAAMLARAALHLGARRDVRGVVHVCGQGETTWHGFAAAILESARQVGIITRVPTLEAIATSEFPTAATRPAYSVLDCRRARSLGVDLPDWQQCLQEELGRAAALG